MGKTALVTGAARGVGHALVTRLSGSDRLGRVIAISMSLNVLGLPIGSAIAGMVIAQASVTAALAIAAATCFASCLLAQLLIPGRIQNAA